MQECELLGALPAQVYIIDDKSGFPEGNGGTPRIKMVARLLASTGASVTVWITRPSERFPHLLNQNKLGSHQGVQFEYTCGSQVRSRHFVLRRIHNLVGLLRVLTKLLTVHKQCADICRVFVYLYSDSPIVCIPVTLLAKLLHFRVIVELCEWPPAVPSSKRLTRWYYEHLRIPMAHGVIAISEDLTTRARLQARSGRPAVITLPILLDIAPVATTDPIEYQPAFPYVFWFGDVDNYLPSVLWLLRALAQASRRFPDLGFVIAGRYTPETKCKVLLLVASLRLQPDRIVLTGFLANRTIRTLCARALALLAPLEDSDRSRARFPTKIGEYVASGRPVITTAVGEIVRFFRDGQTAMITSPGDFTAFGDRIARLAGDPDLAAKIGAAGRELGKEYFEYTVHGVRIAEFLNAL